MNLSLTFPFLLTVLVLALFSCTGQNKKDASDFFLKGNTALTQKNYAEALRLYDEAIAKNPEFSDAYLNKGISLMKLNKINDAYEVLSDAIRIDPTLFQAILVRSEAGILTNHLKESGQDLALIRKEYKDSSRYFLIHGNLMTAEDRTSEALTDYNQAIILDKENTEALVNRGALYYKLGSLETANADFIDAIKINPFQPEALNNLGLIACNRKNWNKAVTYFDQILDRDPANPLALNNKGYVLLEKKQLEEGRKLIEKSLYILPSNGYALRNLGIYFQMKGDIGKAITPFNKAIEIAEPVDNLYGLSGNAWLQSGNRSSACKTWKQGIILNDSVSIAQYKKNCRN